MKAMGGDGGNGGTLGVRPRTYLPSETRRTTQVDRSRDDWTILQATGRKEAGRRTKYAHTRFIFSGFRLSIIKSKQQARQDSVAERSKALE